MARLHRRPVFDIGKTMVARKRFRTNGRAYGPGDVFSWRRLAVAPRRLRQLYDQGWITHQEDWEAGQPKAAEPKVETKVAPQKVTKKVTKKASPKEEPEPEPEGETS